jgi:lipopolysaccharide transport system ATP-binding protein
MSDVAIRVEGLGKQYRIGVAQGGRYRYRTIRETLVDAAKGPFRRAGRIIRGQSAAELDDTIWALKDVSFEVQRGEVVGIIGRNGAGKSTLLKVLSRITEPTEGEAWIHGRVGSLLEVGAGFHLELTGRENVYLNGAILGMKRAEIERKFAEIVDFAELEKFIDTPVKFYSSGMYVRLAFSVAAHLEPEVLLVDEVLAVGDLAFQSKCLGKMEDVAGGGRTVLFVSHNMASIKRLCKRIILLSNGQVLAQGEPHVTIDRYTRSLAADESAGQLTEVVLPELPNLPMQVQKVRLTDDRGELLYSGVPTESGLRISIFYEIRKPIQTAYVMCAITNSELVDVIWTYDGDSEAFGSRTKGTYAAELSLPKDTLVPGRYHVRCAIVDTNSGVVHYPGPLNSFVVADSRSLLAHRNIPWPGLTRMNLSWKTRYLDTRNSANKEKG